LKKANRNGQAFSGFLEHPITFLPHVFSPLFALLGTHNISSSTYRFSSGVETDGLGYDMKRKPAWTDRILHLIGRSVSLQQLSYTGYPHITMSDHRPVGADFLLDVDVYDKEAHDGACKKLYKELAGMEDYPTRVLKLDRTSVDMGPVAYQKTTSQVLTLTNIGADSDVCPAWLHIEPMQASSLLVPLTIGTNDVARLFCSLENRFMLQ
ncbi:hypothetical protein H0H93_011404, partial [Arthromyces matolae]